MSVNSSFPFQAIGVIQSPFHEKFGVARQSLMMSEARGVIKLNPDPRYQSAVDGLEGFSHLWVFFIFDQNIEKGWSPKIMPPRIEAASKMGVFASRSPHRPNPLGMSVLKIEEIRPKALGGVEIEVSGLDILNGSPVIDIKPYLSYVDSIPEAQSGWASANIERFPVRFRPEAEEVLLRFEAKYPRLKALLTQMIELDPRPSSQRRDAPMGDPSSEGKLFAFRLLDFNIRCEIYERAFWITGIDLLVEHPHLARPSSR